MDAVVRRLNFLLQEVPGKVNKYSEEQLSARPGQNNWSKKEILGHLCDSAANNHHRFVRVQFEDQPFILSPYAQNKWVSVQNWQDTPIHEIIELWIVLNKHIIRLIKGIPKEKYSYLLDIGNGENVTLQWLVQDYLDHMEHHLRQIFN